MTDNKLNQVPIGGDLSQDRIVCQNCGWSWKVIDGGNDLYVCHKCGYDNTNDYLFNSKKINVKSNFTEDNLFENDIKKKTNKYLIIGVIAVILGALIIKNAK
jgi:DNA-directed RNA polymerase subunit RPC12/RpoP